VPKHPTPDVVCFDAYRTLLQLVDPVGRLHHALLVAGYEYDRDTVAAAFHAEVAFYKTHQDTGADTTGLHALRMLCAAVFADGLPDGPPAELAMQILVDALHYRLYDDVLPTLDALQSEGIRTAVISNWDCSLVGILIGLGIAERFAVVSASAVVGSRKPERGIFDVTLGALGCPAARAVHVGDDPGLDVVGATGAGMRGIHLDRDATRHASPGRRITSLSELSPLILA
jgi:FMN phosphatase YigB (HAD superfamily)